MIYDLFATAGPRSCGPVQASCRERPLAGFPGAIGLESAKASRGKPKVDRHRLFYSFLKENPLKFMDFQLDVSFRRGSRALCWQAWPSGWVPFPLECWPRSGNELGKCRQHQVVPAEGHCSNLQQITVPLYETCQSVCAKRPYCSTYAENVTGCYLGRLGSGAT